MIVGDNMNEEMANKTPKTEGRICLAPCTKGLLGGRWCLRKEQKFVEVRCFLSKRCGHGCGESAHWP